MYKKGTNKTRKEKIQELLSNDSRSKNQQVWTLALKKKKKGPAPRCQAFSRTQNEGELTVSVTAFMSLMNRIRYRNNVLFLSETTLFVLLILSMLSVLPCFEIIVS